MHELRLYPDQVPPPSDQDPERGPGNEDRHRGRASASIGRPSSQDASRSWTALSAASNSSCRRAGSEIVKGRARLEDAGRIAVETADGPKAYLCRRRHPRHGKPGRVTALPGAERSGGRHQHRGARVSGGPQEPPRHRGRGHRARDGVHLPAAGDGRHRPGDPAGHHPRERQGNGRPARADPEKAGPQDPDADGHRDGGGRAGEGDPQGDRAEDQRPVRIHGRPRASGGRPPAQFRRPCAGRAC